MNCNDTLMTKNRILDGEAGIDEIRVLESHLSGCTPCRDAAREIDRLQAILKSFEIPKEPPGLAKRVQSVTTRRSPSNLVGEPFRPGRPLRPWLQRLLDSFIVAFRRLVGSNDCPECCELRGTSLATCETCFDDAIRSGALLIPPGSLLALALVTVGLVSFTWLPVDRSLNPEPVVLTKEVGPYPGKSMGYPMDPKGYVKKPIHSSQDLQVHGKKTVRYQKPPVDSRGTPSSAAELHPATAWLVEWGGPEPQDLRAHQCYEKAAVLAKRFGKDLSVRPTIVSLLQQANQREHVQARHALGVCHLKGYGADPDPAVAWKLFLSAAKQGHPWSAYRVAQLFESGDGVRADRDAARDWYLVAAKGGVRPAEIRLKELSAKR